MHTYEYVVLASMHTVVYSNILKIIIGLCTYELVQHLFAEDPELRAREEISSDYYELVTYIMMYVLTYIVQYVICKHLPSESESDKKRPQRTNGDEKKQDTSVRMEMGTSKPKL